MAAVTSRSCPCGLPAAYDACCGRFLSGAAAAPTPAPSKIDRGDTAWMLTSTALVLMMTAPGLALFYGGMVRQKNAYLLRTWHPKTRPPRVEFDPGMRWTGLEIVETSAGSAFHTTGTVTFRASYRGGSLHERSRFERVDGAWVYVDGEFLD